MATVDTEIREWRQFIGGTAVIDEFTEVHWITVGKPHPFPF